MAIKMPIPSVITSSNEKYLFGIKYCTISICIANINNKLTFTKLDNFLNPKYNKIYNTKKAIKWFNLSQLFSTMGIDIVVVAKYSIDIKQIKNEI